MDDEEMQKEEFLDEEIKEKELYEEEMEDFESSSAEDLDASSPSQELPQPLRETLTASKDIPFPIVIEIDRIHLPLEKLLSLEPGNVLELPIRPEQGVYLTVHGKKIARGELIKLGDTVGVKILEIGERSPL